MWIPRDAEEVERAAKAGDLEETPAFDAKAALPTQRKNPDLATDVAAMATDGGALLYGVGEDEHKRPTVPAPMALAGALSGLLTMRRSEIGSTHRGEA